MDKIKRCAGCEKAVDPDNSYKINLHEKTKIMLTKEITERNLEGWICKDCSKN